MRQTAGLTAIFEGEGEEAMGDRPDLAPLVAAHVGNTPMRQVLDEVRGVMVDEALARTAAAAVQRAFSA
jgi:hypothetical protein